MPSSAAAPQDLSTVHASAWLKPATAQSLQAVAEHVGSWLQACGWHACPAEQAGLQLELHSAKAGWIKFGLGDASWWLQAAPPLPQDFFLQLANRLQAGGFLLLWREQECLLLETDGKGRALSSGDWPGDAADWSASGGLQPRAKALQSLLQSSQEHHPARPPGQAFSLTLEQHLLPPAAQSLSLYYHLPQPRAAQDEYESKLQIAANMLANPLQFEEDAIFLMASQLYRPQLPALLPTSYDLHKLLAENGHLEARFQLGNLYLHGQGCHADAVQAAYFYRLAAEAGYHEAQIALAKMYDSGRGVKRDPAQATHWYQQAASLGHPEAVAKMGKPKTRPWWRWW